MLTSRTVPHWRRLSTLKPTYWRDDGPWWHSLTEATPSHSSRNLPDCEYADGVDGHLVQRTREYYRSTRLSSSIALGRPPFNSASNRLLSYGRKPPWIKRRPNRTLGVQLQHSNRNKQMEALLVDGDALLQRHHTLMYEALVLRLAHVLENTLQSMCIPFVIPPARTVFGAVHSNPNIQSLLKSALEGRSIDGMRLEYARKARMADTFKGFLATLDLDDVLVWFDMVFVNRKRKHRNKMQMILMRHATRWRKYNGVFSDALRAAMGDDHE